MTCHRRFIVHNDVSGLGMTLELWSLSHQLARQRPHHKRQKTSCRPLAKGRQADELFYGDAPSSLTREEVEDRMVVYMEREHAQRGTPWHSVARHMMGLYNGVPGARRWRQVWSDHKLKVERPREVMRLAHEHFGAAVTDS